MNHAPLYSPPARTTALGLCCLLLAACNSPANGSAPAAIKQVPAIHLEQTAELLLDGQNAALKAYNDTVAACEAGGLPTRRLDDSELPLLGTTRYEMWIDGDSETLQTRSWDVASDGAAGSCQFRLEMSGNFSRIADSRQVEVDLASGAREEVALTDASGLQRFAIAAADDLPGAGFTAGGETQVGGQPCQQWTAANNGDRLCVWSGGRQWGFGAAPVHDHRPGPNYIVLQQQPGNGNGYGVTTQRFTVGEAFDTPAAATGRQP